MASSLTMSPVPPDHPKADLWRCRTESTDGRISYFEAISPYGTLRFGLGSDGRVGFLNNALKYKVLF